MKNRTLCLALQRHLYEHVFKHKELGASKKPLNLVADDRKPAILHGQILATHPSDVVGLGGGLLRSPTALYGSPPGTEVNQVDSLNLPVDPCHTHCRLPSP